jgi:hypothetical protein
LFVRQRSLESTELRHDFFNGFAHESLRVKSRRFANQLIPFTQCERQTATGAPTIIVEFGYRVRVNGVAMNRVTAVAAPQVISGIAG